ncbi:hypothetical protein EBR96_10610, partial [bacterium]|nr:hypothetical protein [bacterium]
MMIPRYIAMTPFNPDRLPSSQLASGKMTVDSFDPKTGEMVLQFESAVQQKRFFGQIMHAVSRSPEAVLGSARQYPPSRFESGPLIETALKRLSNSADKDGNIKARDTFLEHADRIKEKNRIRNKEWEKATAQFYNTVQTIFFSESPRVKDLQTLWDIFNQLGEMKPNSFIRYVPFLTFLSNRLTPKSLVTLMKEAYECDPLQTYQYTTFYTRILISPDFSKFVFARLCPANPATIEALKTLFPADQFLPAISNQLKNPSVPVEMPMYALGNQLNTAVGHLLTSDLSQAIDSLADLITIGNGFHWHHYYL